MSERSSAKVTLETEMTMLKKEEARFRYLVTSNKTSPEYRKEALASLERTRTKIFQLSCKMAALDNAEK
jgi:hypothetical protein